MFIQKRKSKIAYYITISAIAALILIGLTFFDKKVMQLNLTNNGINQAASSFEFISSIATFPVTFISFFVLFNFYITMLAKKNRNNYMLIVFILFNAIHLYFTWNSDASFYLGNKTFSLITIVVVILYSLISYIGCLLFSMYLTFYKKYRTVNSINYLGTQISYGIIFYFGVLISCYLLRIIFGRDTSSYYWFIPNFKSNFYINDRLNSISPNSNVENIGMLLFVSFIFNKKNKWYQAAFNTFIFLSMIATTITLSLNGNIFLTDGFISIIIVVVWYYVSKHIVDLIYGNIQRKRARVYSGEVPESKEIKRAKEKAKKENDKLKKQNEKLAKKQQKEEFKKKEKEKSQVDKEIEDLLKKASKDHKKKIKKGDYDNPDDNDENLKH